MYSETFNGLKDMAWLLSKVWLNGVKYAVRSSKYRSAEQKLELVQMNAAISFEESRTQKNELCSYASIAGKSSEYMGVMLIEDDFALKNVAMPQKPIDKNGVNESAVVKILCTAVNAMWLYLNRVESMVETRLKKSLLDTKSEELVKSKQCRYGQTKPKFFGSTKKLGTYLGLPA